MNEYSFENQIKDIENSNIDTWQKAYEKAVVLHSAGKEKESIDLLKESIDLKSNPDALKKLIKIYINNNELKKAEEYIQKLEDLKYTDWQISLYKAIINFRKGDIEEAYKEFAWIHKIQPRKVEPIYYLALYYFRRKRYIDSLNYLDKIIPLDYKYKGIYILAAKNFYHIGKYKESLENLHEALNLKEETLEDIYYYFSLNYFKLKKYTKALDFINKTLEFNEKADYHFLKGEILYSKRNLSEAIQYYRQAIKLKTKDFNFLKKYIETMLEYKNKNFEEIIKTIDSVYKLHKNNYDYFLLYAKVLERLYLHTNKKINIMAAYDIYKKLLNIPDLPEKNKILFVSKLFDAYLLAKDYKEIINYYIKNPEDLTDVKLQNYIVLAYINLNKLKEANSILERLLSNYGADENLLFSRYLIYKKKKNKEDAFHTLKKIIEINENHLEALKETAELLISNKQYEKGFDIAKKAIKLDYKDIYTLYLLLQALFNLKEYKKAKRILNKIFKIQKEENINIERYIYLKLKSLQLQLNILERG